MATDRQLQANRANARKSTGPVTPRGKRVSSKNATLHVPLATPALRGDSLRRFRHLATGLAQQFQPRTLLEASLVYTMAVAQWHIVRLQAAQTALFDREMDRTRLHHPAETAPATLAALTFLRLADHSRAFTLQHRLELAYSRHFQGALMRILKKRNASPSVTQIFETKAPFEAPPRAQPAAPSITYVNQEREIGPLSKPNPAPAKSTVQPPLSPRPALRRCRNIQPRLRRLAVHNPAKRSINRKSARRQIRAPDPAPRSLISTQDRCMLWRT